jgi:hypothetical protein
MGDMLEGNKVGRPVSFSDTALVISKNNIHYPMEGIFHTSMTADCFGKGIFIGSFDPFVVRFFGRVPLTIGRIS